MTTKNNRIDYVEFAAEDLGAFKKFYGAVFGWTFQDWGPDYVSFDGAGIEGGVRGGEKPQAGSTTVILYADDLEAAEKAVVKAGGVVGAIVAKISDEEADRVSFHDGELDAEIGVNGGDLGAPNLKHPPAIRGTYSAGSAGGGGASSGRTSDGPMPAPKD